MEKAEGQRICPPAHDQGPEMELQVIKKKLKCTTQKHGRCSFKSDADDLISHES
jgi:hypothetical protein